MGQDLRRQFPRCAGASDGARVGDRAGSERAAHAERAVAAGRRVEPRSRGARRISQGPLLLQSAKRRQPAKGDRAIRGGRQVEPGVFTGVLRHVGRLPLGGLQRGLSHGHGCEREGQDLGGEGRAAGRQLRGSAYVAGGLQAVLRVRLGGMRAGIPAGDRAQPELLVRARSVRHGTRVSGTVPGGDRRERARHRAGSAVSPDPGRRDHAVPVSTEAHRGEGVVAKGSRARSDVLLPRHGRGVGQPRGGAVRRRDPAPGEGKDDGGAAVRVGVSGVCLWRRRRSRACDGGAREPQEDVSPTARCCHSTWRW